VPGVGAARAPEAGESIRAMAHDTRLNVMRQRTGGEGKPGGGPASARSVFERVPRGTPLTVLARALYVHVPFCFHKCHYCDFYSLVDTRDRQEAFVARLERELRAQAAWAGPLRTIFVGGGTPSLLRVELWGRVLACLRACFDLGSLEEFTVECNPETVTPELMGVLRAGGVNRVSVGAQSFEARHLKTLERWHDPENVGKAVELARDAGIARQSIDLIFGIPGQTLDEWACDLDRALALGTTHLSCYNLTYEPNTAMTARLKRGEFASADEDVEIEMYRLTRAQLGAAGLDRYEVSNYARVGDEARHNLAYWRGESWLACGPSASGHLRASGDQSAGGWRWKNTPRLDDYLGMDDDGFAPVVDVEEPDAGRALRERLMTGLRLREGIGDDELRARAITPELFEKLRARGERMVERGMLRIDGGVWRVTEEGWLHADGVAGELMVLAG